jgi:hypothetical protein
MHLARLWMLAVLLLATSATAQVPLSNWRFEDPYRDQMLYLHALVNYSHDLQWQFNWERRQLADTSLRVNTGSVTSTELLTDLDLNINAVLNEKWRFQGSFRRTGLRQWPIVEERLLLGLERSIFESSAVYLTVNPEFNKEFIDVAAGYTFYRDERQQYVRVGVLLEDVNYQTKNDRGGLTERNPIALQWLVRLALANDWYLYSEGETGSGFERVYRTQARPRTFRATIVVRTRASCECRVRVRTAQRGLPGSTGTTSTKSCCSGSLVSTTSTRTRS